MAHRLNLTFLDGLSVDIFGCVWVREKNIGFYEERGIKAPLSAESTFSFQFARDTKGGNDLYARNKLEREFQSKLIKDIKAMFRECIVTKQDSDYIQGIPDLLILYYDKWAVLECKKSADEPKQPNQEYYIGLLNEMSFARFIFPENREEVLSELQFFFQARQRGRNARVSRRKQVSLD